MVRINLIEPRNLTDQHLLAEYNDIIIQKLQEKLKMKPNYYTYYGKLVKPDFYGGLK